MSRYRCETAFLLCMFAGALPSVAFAQTTPSWVYDAVNHLEEEGYIDLGGREAASIPHDELTKIVAQGLHEINRIQQGTLADEYGRITSLAVRDEVRLKLYREQEQNSRKLFDRASGEAKHAEEMLARQSMRGVNRLEVMRPPTLAVSRMGAAAILNNGFTYLVNGSGSTEDYSAVSMESLVGILHNLTHEEDGTVKRGAILVMHMSATSMRTSKALDMLLTANEALPEGHPGKFKVGLLGDYLTGDYDQTMKQVKPVKGYALH